MSDVALVAAITGGSSVLTSGVTAAVTWAVSSNSSSVELAKVAAENERLQGANREDERRNRQATYHQYLNAVIKTFQLMGFAASPKKIAKLRDEYRYLHAGVVLFAPRTVRDGAYEVSRVYSEVWPVLNEEREKNPAKSESKCWRDATARFQEEFGIEIAKLTNLMHADITRGVADDPDNKHEASA
ncbi:MAG TPA: hypothetical protein VF009_08540 [Solirubrobacterales bacterium]